jgi:hypothetical protein
MQPKPPPKGDPDFEMFYPTLNEVLGPNFSVYGWGPQTLTTVSAYVGTTMQPALLQVHPADNAINWEAIFSSVAAGSYGVYATCNGGGQTPSSPRTVSVEASPGITIENPIIPGPMEASGLQANPWQGYSVGGTYDSSKINGVTIYLTRGGISFWKFGTTQRIEQAATLNSGNGRWICNLDFMPAAHVGNGFLIHYVASRTTGGKVRGCLTSRFNGPR